MTTTNNRAKTRVLPDRPCITKITVWDDDPQFELTDGSRGWLDWESMTEEGYVPFVYEHVPGQSRGYDPPDLWLPLLGHRLFEVMPPPVVEGTNP
jgi:hypothetical protein